MPDQTAATLAAEELRQAYAAAITRAEKAEAERDRLRERADRAEARIERWTRATAHLDAGRGLGHRNVVETVAALTEDRDALQAELDRLRAQLADIGDVATVEYALQRPDGSVSGLRIRADAIHRIAELNPDCAPVRRSIGAWRPVADAPANDPSATQTAEPPDSGHGEGTNPSTAAAGQTEAIPCGGSGCGNPDCDFGQPGPLCAHCGERNPDGSHNEHDATWMCAPCHTTAARGEER